MRVFVVYYGIVFFLYWASFAMFSKLSFENGFYIFLIFIFGAQGIFPVIFGKNMNPPYTSVILVPGKDRILRAVFSSFFCFFLILSYLVMIISSG